MNTASRFVTVLGLVLAAAGVLVEAPAQAQEVQVTGPLAGAPAVRHMRIYRDGRFQIQPSFGVTINDDYARAMLVGAQMSYHFTDWLGLSAFFHYGAATPDTGLTKQVSDIGQTTNHNRLSLPTADNFSKQIGRIDYLAGLQATFIPLRGKLSLFQALFVDTDLYLFGGVAFAGITERADVVVNPNTGFTPCSGPAFNDPNTAAQARAECELTQSARSSRMALAPTFGLGLSLYFTNYLAMTLEYRAFPFRWNTSGTDERGMGKNRRPDANGEFPDGVINENDRIFHFNQMFTLGLAFYLPVKGKVSE